MNSNTKHNYNIFDNSGISKISKINSANSPLTSAMKGNNNFEDDYDSIFGTNTNIHKAFEIRDVVSDFYKNEKNSIERNSNAYGVVDNDESVNSAIQLKTNGRGKPNCSLVFNRSHSSMPRKSLINNRESNSNNEIIQNILHNNKPKPSSTHLIPHVDAHHKELLKNKINIQEKRKKSLLHRRISNNSRKRQSEMNPKIIESYVKKSEEGSVYGRYKNYLKWSDVLLACLVIANITLSLIDNEIYISESSEFIQRRVEENNSVIDDSIFEYMKTREITVRENTLRFINCIITGCILIVLIVHYYVKVRILRVDQKLSESEGIWKAGLVKYLYFEIVINMIVYPPYLNNVIHGVMLGQPYAYNVNSIVCIAVTFKTYIFLRLYTYFSRWTNDTAKSLCLKHNVVPNVNFAMKAELKKRPYTMLFIVSSCIVVIFSFAVRTFEYYVINVNTKGIENNKLQNLVNSIWLILMTMLTVGYGDLYPGSHFGRLIGVISCVIGLLLVSLIVVSLAIVSEFRMEEKKAYSILKKINAVDNAANKALDVIATFLKLRMMLIEKKKFKLSERFVIITHLKKGISKFKNDYKIANSHSLPVDEMLKLLENKFKDDIVTLDQNVKKIVNVNRTFEKINQQQKICLDSMEVISQRTEKISQYLIELNNENFKKNLQEYREMKRSEVRQRKYTHEVKLKSCMHIGSRLDNNVKRINSMKQ